MDTELAIDKEIAILSHIARSEQVRQRDPSHVIGMSLGMTNAILKRLVHKGYLTIRKVNNRNIAYGVTLAGVEAIAKRSYRYLRRTIGNIVRHKETVDGLVRSIHRSGRTRVVLAGESDLTFIVEHLCSKYGLGFEKRSELHALPPEEGSSFTLFSESVDPQESAASTTGESCASYAYLQQVLAD